MKKLNCLRQILLVVLLINFSVFAKLYATDYTISFTASGAATTVGNVEVQNLTQSTSVVVPAGAPVTLTVSTSTASPYLKANSLNLKIYPNPITEKSIVSFYSEFGGKTDIAVYGMDGRTIIHTTKDLPAGENRFRLSLPQGVYTLQINENGMLHMGTVISQAMNKAELEFSGTEPAAAKPMHKVKASAAALGYNTGDQLLFKGYSGDYCTIVTLKATSDTTVNFNFVECRDADGNNYPVVHIGNQTWMAENLKTTKYRNAEAIGTTIPVTKNIRDETEPRYQWAYSGNESNASKYGRLYTWHAATDSRNIAPTGWHVPNVTEWTTLENYLIANGYNYDGTTTVNKIAKSLAINYDWRIYTGKNGCIGNDLTKNNSSGFTALPGGYRYDDGGFDYSGDITYWWSSIDESSTYARSRYLNYSIVDLTWAGIPKGYGFSVRCLLGDSTIVFTDSDKLSGEVSEDLNLNLDNLVIVSELDTSVVSSGGNFNVVPHSVLMAYDKRTDKPVFYGCPGTDENANYALSAKETALYFALLGIQHIRRPYFKPSLTKIKQALYELQEVKDLEQIITECISSKGFLDYDIIGPAIGVVVDKVMSLSEINTETQTQVRYKTNSLVTIGNTYAATGGYYRVDDKLPDNWNDSYDINTNTYTLKRKMYNQTPAVVGVSMGKYDPLQAQFYPLKGYLGFIEPYYPPNLASIDGNVKNLTQWLTATSDIFKNGLKDGLLNTDAYSEDNTFKFNAIPGEKDVLVFDCGYLDPKVMQGINIAYLFIDNFQDIYESEVFANKNLFVKSDFINDFFGDLASDVLKASEIANYVFWAKNKDFDAIAASLEKLFTDYMDNYISTKTSIFGPIKPTKAIIEKSFKKLVGPIAELYKYSRIGYKLVTNMILTDGENFLGSVPISFDKLSYPSVPISPFPNNISLPNGTPVTFNWDINNSDNQSITFNFYLTNSKNKILNNRGECLLGSGLNTKEYTPKLSLIYNTEYFWQVEAINSDGFRTKSPVWNFTLGSDNINTVTDIDGNIYHTVTLGTQTWMVENLKTTRYLNGDQIGTTSPATKDISTETEPKYQWAWNGDEDKVAMYGRFYTWYAVTDPRNIAPHGWHVPTDDDWTTLKNYLIANGYNYDGTTIGDKTAKALASTTDWNADTRTGVVGNDLTVNNSTGFTALPCGFRNVSGSLTPIGYKASWWSSTGNTSSGNTSSAYFRSLFWSDFYLSRGENWALGTGYNVRCIKDNISFYQIPTVTTNIITDITSSSATSGGNITSDGGSLLTARGVCWNTNGNPTIADSKTSDGIGLGSFTSTMNELTAATTYYVRAYATNNVGTSYGEVIIFTTSTTPENTVTDIDGNVYHTVTIGTQTWMVENLKTTRYRNGDAISEQWAYDGDENNVAKYGRLYTWYAATDSRGIAPAGWHVPTDAEWTILENYLIANGYNYDGTTTGKNIAKALAATTDWNTYTGTGTIGNDLTKNNSSGFTALPGGYRSSNGSFFHIGDYGYWWSSAEGGTTGAWFRYLFCDNYSLGRGYYTKSYGFSVRCLRD